MTDQHHPRDIGSAPRDPAVAEIVKEIAAPGVLPPGIDPANAAAAVLCVLSRRLSGGEARDLLSKLPLALQTMVQPCAAHAELSETFDSEGFMRRVGDHLNVDPVQAASIARVVFAAIRRRLPEKQIRDVRAQLPEDLHDLWGRS